MYTYALVIHYYTHSLHHPPTQPSTPTAHSSLHTAHSLRHSPLHTDHSVHTDHPLTLHITHSPLHTGHSLHHQVITRQSTSLVETTHIHLPSKRYTKWLGAKYPHFRES